MSCPRLWKREGGACSPAEILPSMELLRKQGMASHQILHPLKPGLPPNYMVCPMDVS